jgi:hypothetical protein
MATYILWHIRTWRRVINVWDNSDDSTSSHQIPCTTAAVATGMKRAAIRRLSLTRQLRVSTPSVCVCVCVCVCVSSSRSLFTHGIFSSRSLLNAHIHTVALRAKEKTDEDQR